MDEATVSIAAKQVLVADTKNRLQEGEAKLKAKKERKAQSLQAAAGDVAAAEVQAQASRARLEQCQVVAAGWLYDIAVRLFGWSLQGRCKCARQLFIVSAASTRCV